MTLGHQQRRQIKQLADSLAELRESLEAESPHSLFAEFSQQGGTAILAANEEGLVYFASILMALASEASPGQHFHFDENTVLSRSNSKLILQFLDGPYPEQSSQVLEGGS